MYAVLIENQIFIHLKYNFYTKISVRIGYISERKSAKCKNDFSRYNVHSPFTKRKKGNYLIKLDSTFSRLICTKQRGTDFGN